MRLLLADSRVDRKVRCNEGRTVLDYARKNLDSDVVKLFYDISIEKCNIVERNCRLVILAIDWLYRGVHFSLGNIRPLEL